MGNDQSAMEKNLFNLKFAAKELERSAKKCEKDNVADKGKLKRAIEQGNMEGAKIYAENAIRNKNQALNFRRMASRVDAVSQRVQSAVATKKVTQSMAGVVGSMEAAMKSMNLEQISNLMDRFESQFESLDVQTQVMGDAMQSSTTMTTPQGEVDSLMTQVAEEAGIELNHNLPQAQAGSIGVATASADQDELSQRLAKLRQT
jgi:charged multivesicular body protein 1